MIISISKILQDKQTTAVITTPITRYSPLYKSDSDSDKYTGKRISTSVKYLSIVNPENALTNYYKITFFFNTILLTI